MPAAARTIFLIPAASPGCMLNLVEPELSSSFAYSADRPPFRRTSPPDARAFLPARMVRVRAATPRMQRVVEVYGGRPRGRWRACRSAVGADGEEVEKAPNRSAEIAAAGTDHAAEGYLRIEPLRGRLSSALVSSTSVSTGTALSWLESIVESSYAHLAGGGGGAERRATADGTARYRAITHGAQVKAHRRIHGDARLPAVHLFVGAEVEGDGHGPVGMARTTYRRRGTAPPRSAAWAGS